MPRSITHNAAVLYRKKIKTKRQLWTYASGIINDQSQLFSNSYRRPRRSTECEIPGRQSNFCKVNFRNNRVFRRVLLSIAATGYRLKKKKNQVNSIQNIRLIFFSNSTFCFVLWNITRASWLGGKVLFSISGILIRWHARSFASAAGDVVLKDLINILFLILRNVS